MIDAQHPALARCQFFASRPGELVDFRDSSIVRHGPTEEEAKGAQAFSLRDLFQESGCHKRPGNRDGRLRRGDWSPRCAAWRARSDSHSDSTSRNARAQVSAAAGSMHLEIVNFAATFTIASDKFDQNDSCGTTAGSPDKCGIARIMACFRNMDADLEAAGAVI